MTRNPRLIAAIAAVGMIAVAAPMVAASNGLGPVPGPGAGTDWYFEGGADVSNGVDPAPGGAGGGFLKGSDSYGTNVTTTVNFSLPSGVTIDPEDVEYDTNCDELADPVVTVDGSTIKFALGCAPGESFEWGADVTSLITEPGEYYANIEYKIGTTKRVKDGVSMRQIKPAGSFWVGED